MPKIHTITTDTEVNGTDKLLGSDSSAGTKNHTKNYLINDLKTFMLDSDDLQSFKTIAVSGQGSVVADAKADTLTLAEGSNVTITTDPNTDTVTIASTDTNTTYTAGDGLDLTSTEFAVDTTVVRTSGAQDIAGVKNFTDNVGIGTSSPSYPLEIVSNEASNIYGVVDATNADGTAAWVAYNNQDDNVVYRIFGSGATGTQLGQSLGRCGSLIYNGGSQFLVGSFSNSNFILGTNNTERMRIAAGGNVLIGTTTDNGDKLQVDGDVTVTGDINGDLTGDVTGNVTGNLTGNVTGNVTGNLTGNPTVTEIAFSSTLGKIKEASVTVSSVDLLALNNGGDYTLIAAPGSNRAIIPMSITIASDPGATAFNFNEDLYIGHENEVSSTSTDYFAAVGSGFINNATILFRHFPEAKAANEHVDIRTNDPLVLHATGTATVTAGNGQLKVKILYREVDFS